MRHNQVKEDQVKMLTNEISQNFTIAFVLKYLYINAKLNVYLQVKILHTNV